MEYRAKLDQLEAQLDDLARQLADPSVMSDTGRYGKLAKAHSDLAGIVEKYREWKALQKESAGARSMLEESDAEMRELAQKELEQLEQRCREIEQELQVLLLPKDPNDDKSVVLEVRAGTGGDEAALFAGEILRMYTRYAESQGWRVELTSLSESSLGGIKEAVALISGDKVYSKMKYESGVHRVQRVPATEQQGRIHTSAVTVAVLPEADEVEVQIDAKDIRIDTFCSSGPGGQSVNTTYSAVRITHLPTGTVVSCQDEKSQIKNRAKALRVLRSRLYEMERQKQHEAMAEERRNMVGSGDRSEKIRTYNFRDNRVTDHRIGLTLYQLEDVMDGKVQPLIDGLNQYYQAEKLKQEAA